MRSKRFPPQKGKVLRGVHPKSHGCVAADFTVLKYIESRYRVGLFAEPKTYKAMIRFSNASVLQLPDLKGGNGSRGMAIKVLGVKGPIMLADSGARNQDFLMINTPEFANDAAGALGRNVGEVLGVFGTLKFKPSYFPVNPEELLARRSNRGRRPDDPAAF